MSTRDRTLRCVSDQCFARNSINSLFASDGLSIYTAPPELLTVARSAFGMHADSTPAISALLGLRRCPERTSVGATIFFAVEHTKLGGAASNVCACSALA